MIKFAKKNELEFKEYEIKDLKQNEVFPEEFIKKIFILKDGQVDLITDSTFNKSFLILPVKTIYKKIEKNSAEFEKYEAKARLNLINKIFDTFDQSLNKKYNVELNERTIKRVKNSFWWKLIQILKNLKKIILKKKNKSNLLLKLANIIQK